MFTSQKFCLFTIVIAIVTTRQTECVVSAQVSFPNTIEASFTAEHLYGVGGTNFEPVAAEVGHIYFDNGNSRVLYDYMTTTNVGEKWKNQDLFTNETFLSITCRDGSNDPLASGRPNQTSSDWLAFVGNQRLAALTGHLMLGEDGYDIRSMEVGDLESGEVVKKVGDFEIEITFEPNSRSQIKKLRWHCSKPLINAGDVASGEYEVHKRQLIDGISLPIEISEKVTRSGGIVRLPEGRTIGNSNSTVVPPKTFLSRSKLTNVRVNESIAASRFDSGLKNDFPVTNWSAPHIQHVLVDNKIVPRVDRTSQSLIESSRFSSRTRIVWLMLLLCAVTTLIIVSWKLRSAARLILFAVAYGCGGVSSSACPIEKVTEYTPLRGPYCGVYSMLSALKAVGVEYNTQDALNSEFISTHQGSSIGDLVRLAERAQSQAVPFRGLRVEQLELTRQPLVLHFKSRSVLEYDHWVAFLGLDSSGVPLVFDPPGRLAPMSWGELMSRWSGRGIIVGRNLDPVGVTFVSSLVVFAKALRFLFAAFSLVLFISARSHRRGAAAGFSFATGAMLIFMTMLHAFSPAGLIANFHDLHVTIGLQSTGTLGEITSQDLLTNPEVFSSSVWIDTRHNVDFLAGTIPGAINLPFQPGSELHLEFLQRFRRNQPFVVFCQSSRCSMAELTANWLAENGFANVRIFRPGFEGWKARHEQ